MPHTNKKINNLQNAALKLLHIINKSLDTSEGTAHGLFRVTESKTLLTSKMAEILQGNVDFNNLTQSQRAELLKGILRELKERKVPVFSTKQFDELNNVKSDNTSYTEAIKNALNDCSGINKKIAFYLFHLLNKVSKINTIQMPASNLSRVITPNMFEMLTPQEELSKLQPQITIISDLITRSGEIRKIQTQLVSTHYEHEVHSKEENRYHAFSVNGNKLKQEFQSFTGDLLKSKILLSFKEKLEQTTSENIDQIINDIQSDPEYKVLEKGQGLVTRFFGLTTSSVKAFDEMVTERKMDLELGQSLGLN